MQINSSELTDEERLSIGGQNFAVISQNQLNWLKSEALNMQEEWKIICVSHISCDTGRPNMGISNAEALRDIINEHNNIIAYIYGHTHISVNYQAKNGIQYISNTTCGGVLPSYTEPGHNWSRLSSAAASSAATGSMLFNVCVLCDDNIIRTFRWGVKDDVFAVENCI